ncbi:YebC/PmpR family DNA-binding transcriptional regulator [Patescibacteria group bacterium]|nr:YebC/PmpR family DNA-binding transcriptional regulator [Patescibacteria group bacterium]
MSGHNKWSQIKHKKGATDAKKSKLFSKLLHAISIAAKTEPNPQFNPRLRTAVETAKEKLVSLENIENAINKASEQKNLEEMTIEAYGPEGVAIIIKAITDNTNRTISEIKKILTDYEAKLANPGSVLWGFSAEGLPACPARDQGGSASGGDTTWKSKFPQNISSESKNKIEQLITELENYEDTQNVFTNIN